MPNYTVPCYVVITAATEQEAVERLETLMDKFQHALRVMV